MSESKQFFTEHGYCVIKNAILGELRDFVTQYALFDEMQNFSSADSQVPNAHSKYSDPAMESMLLYLQKIIEDGTGLSLHPTYSYYRVYRNGDKLVPHKDRPSCEISATMCFNYSYTTQELNWPIFMEGNKIILTPGDLVIYRGCELNHWRELLTHSTEVWHVQGFFHYVDAAGPYSEFKYDKRSSIGMVNRINQVPNATLKSYITTTV